MGWMEGAIAPSKGPRTEGQYINGLDGGRDSALSGMQEQCVDLRKFGGATCRQGGPGACPGKLKTHAAGNGASEASPRAEGMGRKLV